MIRAHRHAWWLVLLQCACPRLVAPPTPEPVTPQVVPMEVLRARVEPVRDGAWRTGSGQVVCGFVGDTLVVEGRGWDPGVARIQVGGAALDVATDSTETVLRAVIPADLVDGSISVISGERASPINGVGFCALGLGHPPAPSYTGPVEPRVTIVAAGTAGPRCPPIKSCLLYTSPSPRD